MNIFLCAFCC